MAGRSDAGGLLWLRPEPSGRKPRYTRAEIARAAIEIADDEGFDAVTMKRVASALGAGTMTLYYYVRTKADLVAVMQDAIFEDVVIPADDLPPGWREAVTAISQRTRATQIRHPWAVSSLGQAQFGPNAIRHYEQSLAALASTDLDWPAKTAVTAIVDDYVAGAAIHAVETVDRVRAGTEDPKLAEDARAHGDALFATGEFPQLQALAAAPPAITDPRAALDRQFADGLEALLDGLEARFRIGPGAPPAP